MDVFYVSVVSIAIILLIILLTLFGIKVNDNSNVTQSFPPAMTDCPDYWDMDSSGNCIIPSADSKNTGKIYKNGSLALNSTDTPGINVAKNTISFNSDGWTGASSGICSKKTWAATNNIFWDGVSNYNKC
jgi:hypothetical protein